MVRTVLLFCVFLISVSAFSQDLEQIRSTYPLAAESEEITEQMDGQLANVPQEQATLLAYKGAVKTLKAKFAEKVRDKKDFFKEGVAYIEKALEAHPENVELHYIRMTVQEHAPRVVGYHDKLEEDKKFILEHFRSISSEGLKKAIRDFAQHSDNFDDSEAATLQ